MSDTSGFGIVPRYLRGTLDAYEIAMYVALSWRADEHGISWAKQSLLADEAGMGRTKAQAVLNSLEAKGLVKSMPWANGKGRSSNVYAVRVWAEPVLSDDTIRRTDGHAMATPKPSDQAERQIDVPSHGTSSPSHGTSDVATRAEPARHTAEVPAEDGSARHTSRPMLATRAAEVEPVEEDKPSSRQPSASSDGFREFWLAYPKMGFNGKKDRCRDIWLALEHEDRRDAYRSLMLWKNSIQWTEHPEQIPTPFQWLDDETWRGDKPKQKVDPYAGALISRPGVPLPLADD